MSLKTKIDKCFYMNNTVTHTDFKEIHETGVVEVYVNGKFLGTSVNLKTAQEIMDYLSPKYNGLVPIYTDVSVEIYKMYPHHEFLHCVHRDEKILHLVNNNTIIGQGDSYNEAYASAYLNTK